MYVCVYIHLSFMYVYIYMYVCRCMCVCMCRDCSPMYVISSLIDMDVYNLITGIIYTLLVVKIRLEGPLANNLCHP